MADLSTEIKEIANNPRAIDTNGLKLEEHNLKDLIEADKYLRGRDAGTDQASGKLPIAMFKFKPPGSC